MKLKPIWVALLTLGAVIVIAIAVSGRNTDTADAPKPSPVIHPGDSPSPFDQCAGGEDRERLAAALLQMEPLYREVLVLRFHEDLSLEEIANVTRAPLSTVKSRLYRGLASMKPKLQASNGSEPAAI